MKNYDKYPSKDLYNLFSDRFATDGVKSNVSAILLHRAIEGEDLYAKDFLFSYFEPLVKDWIKGCVYRYNINKYTLMKKKDEWKQEVFVRFIEAIKNQRFVWMNTGSTCKFIKSICQNTVLEDSEVNIRAFKREVQRSFRLNIEKTRAN